MIPATICYELTRRPQFSLSVNGANHKITMRNSHFVVLKCSSLGRQNQLVADCACGSTGHMSVKIIDKK